MRPHAAADGGDDGDGRNRLHWMVLTPDHHRLCCHASEHHVNISSRPNQHHQGEGHPVERGS